MFAHYLAVHNATNTEITVSRRGRTATYPIEFCQAEDRVSTASMIAVGKFLAQFGLSGEPIDQERDAKARRSERRGEYATRVRVA